MSACAYILLLADVHANRDALVRVAQDARGRYRDHWPLKIWFLGDLFGRGPAPVSTWRWLMLNNPEASVVGNHDWGVIGKLRTIQVAAEWDGDFGPQTDWPVILKHRQELAGVGLLALDGDQQPQGGEVLAGLTTWPLVCSPRPSICLVHGGADWPLEAQEEPPSLGSGLDHYGWGYVKGPEDARCTLRWLRWLYENRSQGLTTIPTGRPPEAPRLVIVGHYHRRVLYHDGRGDAGWESVVELDREYGLDAHSEHPALISPGSVGFPREDHDRDASYAVLRLEHGVACSVAFHKVPFDRDAVRADMERKGYPQQVARYLYMPGESVGETIHPH